MKRIINLEKDPFNMIVVGALLTVYCVFMLVFSALLS